MVDQVQQNKQLNQTDDTETIDQKVERIKQKFNKGPVSQDDKIFHILDHVYLGTENGANDKALLYENQIKHVINCDKHQENFFPNDFQYTHLMILDLFGSDISQYFDQTNKAIFDAGQKNENVYIHCAQGLSRSVSILISWLIQSKKMKLAEAVETVAKGRKRNPMPNPSYWKQLKNLEKKVHNLEICSFDYSDWVLNHFLHLGLDPHKSMKIFYENDMDADKTLDLYFSQ